MSITVEMAKAHKNDPAVLCCRREAGKKLEAADFEDPTLFDDYVDSGLLTIPDETLKIGEALGATLKNTTDALNALTPDLVTDIQKVAAPQPAAPQTDVAVQSATVLPKQTTSTLSTDGQSLKLTIAEGKGIHLEIPLALLRHA